MTNYQRKQKTLWLWILHFLQLHIWTHAPFVWVKNIFLKVFLIFLRLVQRKMKVNRKHFPWLMKKKVYLRGKCSLLLRVENVFQTKILAMSPSPPPLRSPSLPLPPQLHHLHLRPAATTTNTTISLLVSKTQPNIGKCSPENIFSKKVFFVENVFNWKKKQTVGQWKFT